eukprot:5112442-Lingulodinium_polyedra.AAC.1
MAGKAELAEQLMQVARMGCAASVPDPTPIATPQGAGPHAGQPTAPTPAPFFIGSDDEMSCTDSCTEPEEQQRPDVDPYLTPAEQS